MTEPSTDILYPDDEWRHTSRLSSVKPLSPLSTINFLIDSGASEFKCEGAGGANLRSTWQESEENIRTYPSAQLVAMSPLDRNSALVTYESCPPSSFMSLPDLIQCTRADVSSEEDSRSESSELKEREVIPSRCVEVNPLRAFPVSRVHTFISPFLSPEATNLPS